MVQKRANQADIAERLGVSVSTVSRALANEIGISDAVRADVQRVARSLGYKSKRSLSAVVGDKKAVALVPLGSATSGLAGFYFGIVEGMREQAASMGMALDVRLVNESVVTLDLVKKQVAQGNAGGVLLAGIDAWDELAEWSDAAEVPVVLVNGSDPQMRLSSVSPANFYGAYMATERLLKAGHRRILHFTHHYRPTIRQRQRGFEQAIARTPGAVGVIVNDDDRKTMELLADILAGKHDVTAAFIWNDIAAVEMLDGLYGPESPLKPGFSIVGFDDLPLAGMATPRLSTMRVDREAIGRGAVRLLSEHMDGERAIQQLEIGVSMVEGETVFSV
ncbi:MAG: LacI family DNA-binding transcriptional regulator [Candidatus Devosia phytovorans]|uniref:LacI family DNA-binding transcriptional regulator n=1 Tax=Candidatus Devosia phytovorans TaxID=3121372 RepID=A0AAJ5VV99_9HYPH|nr:LacI family DNA-binding transcriptional regulator [Devosia sp.]WEK05007.1 MAG: LacI family DNA-binding transcriptional regulator [Devosia sp.]